MRSVSSFGVDEKEIKKSDSEEVITNKPAEVENIVAFGGDNEKTVIAPTSEEMTQDVDVEEVKDQVVETPPVPVFAEHNFTMLDDSDEVPDDTDDVIDVNVNNVDKGNNSANALAARPIAAVNSTKTVTDANTKVNTKVNTKMDAEPEAPSGYEDMEPANYVDAEDYKEPGLFEKVKDAVHDINDNIEYADKHPIETMKKVGVGIGAFFAARLRRRSFNKVKRKGTLVHNGDFDYAIHGSELVVLKYKGSKSEVEVPAVVGNLPVRYLHPDWLYSQTNLFDNYKVRNVMNSLKGDNVNAYTAEKPIRRVILPESLVAIPDKTFTGCKNLEELVIPKSVKSISQNAFNRSGVKRLYFNGDIPKKYDTYKFKGEIYQRKEYYYAG